MLKYDQQITGNVRKKYEKELNCRFCNVTLKRKHLKILIIVLSLHPVPSLFIWREWSNLKMPRVVVAQVQRKRHNYYYTEKTTTIQKNRDQAPDVQTVQRGCKYQIDPTENFRKHMEKNRKQSVVHVRVKDSLMGCKWGREDSGPWPKWKPMSKQKDITWGIWMRSSKDKSKLCRLSSRGQDNSWKY